MAVAQRRRRVMDVNAFWANGQRLVGWGSKRRPNGTSRAKCAFEDDGLAALRNCLVRTAECSSSFAVRLKIRNRVQDSFGCGRRDFDTVWFRTVVEILSLFYWKWNEIIQIDELRLSFLHFSLLLSDSVYVRFEGRRDAMLVPKMSRGVPSRLMFDKKETAAMRRRIFAFSVMLKCDAIIEIVKILDSSPRRKYWKNCKQIKKLLDIILNKS